MLTDKQLTETAYRVILHELTKLGVYDQSDTIADTLHEMYCPDGHTAGRCDRRDDCPRETRHIHAAIKQAVLDLKGRLATLADDEGIDLKVNA